MENHIPRPIAGKTANPHPKTQEKTMRKATFLAAALASASLALTATGADWYVAPGGTGGGTSPSDRGDLMDVLYNGQVAAGDTIHLAVPHYTLFQKCGRVYLYFRTFCRVPIISFPIYD